MSIWNWVKYNIFNILVCEKCGNINLKYIGNGFDGTYMCIQCGHCQSTGTGLY